MQIKGGNSENTFRKVKPLYSPFLDLYITIMHVLCLQIFLKNQKQPQLTLRTGYINISMQIRLSKIRNFILPPYLILYVFLNQIIQLVG
jgi:hypothetical protein